MTITWTKARGVLLGCIVALSGAACDDDGGGGGGGSMDSGTSQDSGSQDSGSQDSGSLDSGSQDAAAPQVATVRLGHLAYGVGTYVAGTAGNPVIPSTWKAHVCVETASASNPNNVSSRVLFTARNTAAQGQTPSWAPFPLQYGAISAYQANVPIGQLNSNDFQTRIARVYAADDLDTSAGALGTAQAALCVPKANVSPLVSFTIPVGGTAGAFEANRKYTILVTGRNDWTQATPTVPNVCLDATMTPGACPAPAIQVIVDDHATPGSGLSAWRVVNTATTYAVGGSCTALVDPTTAANNTPNSGASDPVHPGTGAMPTILPRVTTAPSNTFYTAYEDRSNLAGVLVAAGPPPVVQTRLLGPALLNTQQNPPVPFCPLKLFVPADPTNPPSSVPNGTTEQYANGSLPQSTTLTASYNPTNNPGSATALAGLGTTDGNIVTVFIVDRPPADANTPSASPVPVQIVIHDNAP